MRPGCLTDIALIRPRVDDVICFRLETKGFVSFDAGGGSTDMMSQRVHGNKDHCQRKPPPSSFVNKDQPMMSHLFFVR